MEYNPPGPTPRYLQIAGFKSIHPDQPARIEIRGLTLLAGANSSGKSAVMQPILLMKQTLEAAYDPGPLLIDGPHVQFSALDQMLCQGVGDAASSLSVEFGPTPVRNRLYEQYVSAVRVHFTPKSPGNNRYELAPPRADISIGEAWVAVNNHISVQNLFAFCAPDFTAASQLQNSVLSVVAFRCDLHIDVIADVDNELPFAALGLSLLDRHFDWIRPLLHLPGLRGHRERLYPTAHAGDGDFITAQGPFTPYVAAVLARWQASDADTAKACLARVIDAMSRMGLTSTVRATRINAAQIELKVSRLPVSRQGGKQTSQQVNTQDLVDIADVGFGVSQVLPVVVALAAAVPNQVVYIEQPELHLHPRAQTVMGQLLVDAVNRGVKVIVETHSRMILRAIQTAVARRRITPDAVALHWFSRDAETGATRVDLAELDSDGAFGDWPVDFAEAEAEADDAWLDAVFEHQR